jgi:hypothetical protein
MNKSLQNQFNLIKEGKGHKDVFLKHAKNLFPEYLPNYTTYNEAVNILKQKNIINEGIGGVVTKKTFDPFKGFNEFLQEEKISKEVEEASTKGFDYKDPKNIDNLYSEAFIKGFYTEMGDPKNKDKSTDELKEIVAKNLTKDKNFYVKDGQFGVKGVGYTTEHPGLGTPKEPKGKYKSSGYGDLKESKLRKIINTLIKEEMETRSVGPMHKPEGFQVGDKVKYKGINHEITRIVDDRIYIKNLKYGGRPETWVKAPDLKKSKLKEEMYEDISGTINSNEVLKYWTQVVRTEPKRAIKVLTDLVTGKLSLRELIDSTIEDIDILS